LGIISVDFNIIDQKLIIYSAFAMWLTGEGSGTDDGVLQCGLQNTRRWTKSKNSVVQKEMVVQLVIDFKNAYDSVSREVMSNILTEFGMHVKLGRLIKKCLTL
jgi:hypothetical protein